MAARLCSLCASLEFHLFYNELIEASVPLELLNSYNFPSNHFMDSMVVGKSAKVWQSDCG
jgi:hypothetical protein